MISARGLTRSFRGRTGSVEAVSGMEFEVGAGEIVGFLGPNGAGKTTTVRMLSTLLAPTSGTAEVAGYDIVADRARVRTRIGLVSQAGGTGSDHRVGDELRTQARLYGMTKAQAEERARSLLEEFRLTDLHQRQVRTLSGGQRRRLDIAMGLVHRPGVVFLDEPTAGLDPQSRADLWNHVRALREQHGMTLLLTTHYLEEADLLCDRVLVVDGGRVVADGTPEELKSEVGGDVVALTTDQPGDAARAVSRLFPGVRPDVREGLLQFSLREAQSRLPELLRGLDLAGVRLASVAVTRPSLDDVFLRLTGRSLDGPSPDARIAAGEGEDAEEGRAQEASGSVGEAAAAEGGPESGHPEPAASVG
ncbi:ATP-binding cassette domain-containing protein [Streptantibioticus parmotrematis]|uniref:ATP-binding cassette domain-containing protein n=1 Tax=Streptantibioticus parmotrematis TaxID=2873249 RepID=UPI0027DF2CA0|nr:ATP-binding cassette domain-containing protein [Streptantibioticus parmotrematis]